MENRLTSRREVLLTVGLVASLLPLAFWPKKTGLDAVVDAFARQLGEGLTMDDVTAVGLTFRGAQFDFGFYHGLAVMGGARRHAVRVASKTVHEVGARNAAQAAVVELLSAAI